MLINYIMISRFGDPTLSNHQNPDIRNRETLEVNRDYLKS
jgi:hypothetical protein